MGTTTHEQLVADAAFTGIQVFQRQNQGVGATLMLLMTVNSFTGGVAPSLRAKLFFREADGTRIGTKMNQGLGTLLAPGLHILIFGPDGNNASIGDDKNSGMLPKLYEIEIESNGDQTSADMKVDLATG